MSIVETPIQNCYIPYMTGTELKKKRTSFGYSQQKLSTVFGLSVSTIARWEQMADKPIPNSEMLEFALKGLEIHVRKTAKDS